MEIESPEQAKEIRVWAIPDEAREFKDELIVMIKDNPVPLVIPLRCQGSKSSIEILEGAPLKFTRILLNQTIKRELKIKNTSAIPVDFRLEGCEKLPAEFAVNIKQGRLRPNENITIEVTFKALKQQKFNETLKLVAEDTEGLKKISEPKDIQI
jgi:hydrocephalus-inducing protein